jgi:hypothetical protein
MSKPPAGGPPFMMDRTLLWPMPNNATSSESIRCQKKTIGNWQPREYMRKVILILTSLAAIVLTVLVTRGLMAQTIDRDQCLADIRQLAETIEAAHPDPYTNGGGKIAFHRRLHDILGAVPDEGMTKNEFYRLICPLVASIGDMHTWMNAPYKHNWSTGPWGIPLYFGVVEWSLYVKAVFDSSHQRFLGARLIAVEGVPFDDLVERNRRRAGFENGYGVLRDMARTGVLMQAAYLEHLLPEWTDKKKIRLTLRLPDGTIEKVTLDIPSYLNFMTAVAKESKTSLPARDKCDFVYEFLDPDKQTALLVIDGMMSYREAFELWNNLEFYNNNDRAKRVYEKYHSESAPDDINETIAGLPSATEVFRSMVRDMKEAGTNTLLIDLRRNDGGNSYMSEILVYFLYGRDAFLKPKTGFIEINKYSAPYFEYFENESIDKINEGRPYPLTANDYDFTLDFAHRENATVEQVAAEFETVAEKMTTFYAEYQSGDYEAWYCPPNVIVLSSPFTFSSGYTLMRKLYQAGADILGTPSAQAGNCFGDIMRMSLDNTGITYTLSRKYYETFPDDHQLGKVLAPTYPLKYDILASYGFDPNTEIIYALDIVKE